MKSIILNIVFYLIIGIFCYMGFKEIYPLIKNKFRFNYRFLIGLIYIITSIAMLIRGDWLPMLVGAVVAFILKITFILDKQLRRKNQLMTPKQIDRIQNKINKIRKEIYEEKKIWGGYHDGRGLRYIPFELYLKIQDFKGGLTYLRWFTKTFPDDITVSEIMLMSSLIYFKNKKIKDAEKKALQSYFADSYVFNIFMDRPIKKDNDSNYNLNAIKDFFADLKKQNDLTDFQNWLADFEKTETFKDFYSKYQELQLKLDKETDDILVDNLFDKIHKLKKLEKY